MSVAEIPVSSCPFCGSKNCSPNRYIRTVWCECDDCGARGPKLQRDWHSGGTDEYILDLNAAVEVWNIRA